MSLVDALLWPGAWTWPYLLAGGCGLWLWRRLNRAVPSWDQTREWEQAGRALGAAGERSRGHHPANGGGSR